MGAGADIGLLGIFGCVFSILRDDGIVGVGIGLTRPGSGSAAVELNRLVHTAVPPVGDYRE